MVNVWNDVRYALRGFRRAPLFTAIAVISLAFGIGANTAIFTLLDQILLRLLPVKEPQQLALLTMRGRHYGSNWGGKPLLVFPQKFYRGEHPVLLDMSPHPEVKFLRAHWEVARWGRGEATARFEFSLKLREVSAEVLEETTAALQGL